MIKNFVKILELLGDRLEVCVSVLTQKLTIFGIFIKVQFVNKGNELINLPSIFKDKYVIYYTCTCFKINKSSIICY